MMEERSLNINSFQDAASSIKIAILQSQLRAVRLINQEQLALYYGIGRFISQNTRKKHWGSSAIKSISTYLKQDLPGLRGFSETNIKNMRLFYEAWIDLDQKSSVQTDNLSNTDKVSQANTDDSTDNEEVIIRQFGLTNLDSFPIVAFMCISFTHHIAIINNAKVREERLFYIQYCNDYKVDVDGLKKAISMD